MTLLQGPLKNANEKQTKLFRVKQHSLINIYVLGSQGLELQLRNVCKI
jgi:hypothetical protein